MTDELTALKASLFDKVLDLALSSASAGKLMGFVAGSTDSIDRDFFNSELDDIYDVLKEVPPENLVEIFKPHLGPTISRAVEAKSVVIEW